MKNRNISPVGDDWDDLRKELFSQEEIAECDLKVAILGARINARQENGLTQKQLEAASGEKQPDL
jgi:hypothetical protein